jgi:Fe-S-cluster-containing dehydrogenase component
MVLDINTCTGCRACMAACAMENGTPFWAGKFRTHVEDRTSGTFPDVKREIMPRLCMQCDNPPCVSVCPTGASHKVDGGIVVVDEKRCMGCKYCIVACPYQTRFVYDAADVKKAREVYGEGPKAESVDKCTFCQQRLKEGRDPACVSTCLAGARIFGDLDDPKSQVAQLVASGKARPLRPDLGTKPRVFYLGKEG